MGNVNRHLEAGESKRSITEDLGVPQSALRKRFKRGTGLTSLGRFKTTISNGEQKELSDCCKDADANF
jgi:hypothetical protein